MGKEKRFCRILMNDSRVAPLFLRTFLVYNERRISNEKKEEGGTLLCSRQSMVGKGISQWIGKDFEKLNIVATYNLVYNASLMVEEGIGYALSLDKLVNTTGNSALCFKPLEPKLEVGLNIVWKKSQVFSKAAKKFLEMLESELS